MGTRSRASGCIGSFDSSRTSRVAGKPRQETVSSAPIPAAIPPGPTPEYGRYLAVSGGCTFCHGDNLKGGLKDGPPGTPLSANLTQAGPLGQWTEADFTKALREGVRPDGSNINPFMPWRLARLMTDEEIAAVWAYLKTVGG